MKKIFKSSVLAAAIIGCGATGVLATPDLYDWGVNINGTVSEIGYYGDQIPLGVDASGFDQVTGLGTITYKTSAIGSSFFLAFFDHEIVEELNTFFDESGFASGTPGTGQTWEIDVPDYPPSTITTGDIYYDFLNNSLDGGEVISDDVSMAMGWGFTVNAGETAFISLTLSEIMPTSGFWLTHSDPGDGNNPASEFYLSGNLRIGSEEVPEPATMLLMGAGLAGLLGVSRRKKNK